MKFNRTNMIVLGILMNQPMNGYEIQNSAKFTTNLFWSELKFGHIYPALQSLLVNEYVSIHKKITSDKGKKSIKYKITKKGCSYLDAWIENDECTDITKSETLAKLFFSSKLNVETQIERINRLFQDAEKNLDLLNLQKIPLQNEIEEMKNPDPSLIFQLIVLDFGLNFYAGMKNLTQNSLTLLEKIE